MGSFLGKYRVGFKQAFAGVMTMAMLIALILSWIVTSSANIAVHNALLHKSNPELRIMYDGQRSELMNTTSSEKRIGLLLFVNTWTPLVVFFLSSIIASVVFYNWKMRKPLSLLKASIEKINDQDLGFSLKYDVQDEMGELISSFEQMRAELQTSFTAQWRAAEERRLLNASFAHDMRTPLTVLKGQTDILCKNVKTGKASSQTVLDTLTILARHICRIEEYTDQMAVLQRLEEVQAVKKETNWSAFWPVVQASFEQLALAKGKAIQFDIPEPVSQMLIDESLIMRILENIVANAVRHASRTVTMRVEAKDEMVISVIDDGPGFSEKALQSATKPFYRERRDKNGELSDGLGLFISKTLTERHGGYIEISNDRMGGGCVKVVLKLV